MAAELSDLIPADAPTNVIKYTLLYGFSGAAVGSLVGVARNTPALPMATSIAFREYMAMPLSRCMERKQNSFHTKHMAESALAGALSGGLLVSYRYGLARFPSAAFTTALGACGLQLLVNELDFARVAYVARKEKQVLDERPRLSFLDWVATFKPIRKLTPQEFEAKKAQAAAEAAAAAEAKQSA